MLSCFGCCSQRFPEYKNEVYALAYERELRQQPNRRTSYPHTPAIVFTDHNVYAPYILPGILCGYFLKVHLLEPAFTRRLALVLDDEAKCVLRNHA